MSTLGAFLTAAAGPLAKRVLTALGVGVVSFVGADAALSSMVDLARGSWSGLAPTVAAYMAFAGVNRALAIIVGAILARLAYAMFKRLALL